MQHRQHTSAIHPSQHIHKFLKLEPVLLHECFAKHRVITLMSGATILCYLDLPQAGKLSSSGLRFS
jgi:hypothetical protein